MRGELAGDRVDRADDRLAGRARAELLEYPVANAVPVRVADVPVDPHVAQDGQLMVVDREVDKHAVPLRRAVHAELREDRPRTREGVHRLAEDAAWQAALQVHADLGRGPRLGSLDGVGDRLEVRLAEKAPRPLRGLGHVLPASARAAAARPAPAAREAPAAATAEPSAAAPEDGPGRGPAAAAPRRVAATLTRGPERDPADRQRREHEEEQRVQVGGRLALPLAPRALGWPRGPRSDPRVDSVRGGLEAGRVALLAEARRDQLADDLARGGVGHDRLEA